MRDEIQVLYYARPPEWSERAVCMSLWDDFDDERQGPPSAHTRKLQQICNDLCPVRIECLDAALLEEAGMSIKDRARCGIRGGLTGAQRGLLQAELDINMGRECAAPSEGETDE